MHPVNKRVHSVLGWVHMLLILVVIYLALAKK